MDVRCATSPRTTESGERFLSWHQHSLRTDLDNVRQAGGLRQYLGREEFRARDLAARECLISVLRTTILKAQHRRAHELPPSRDDAPQLEVADRRCGG